MKNNCCIIRILGNDLPPRHYEKQTILNLQYLLNHENNFPNTTKLFILNRIVNKEIEKEIISLLAKYNMEYVIIPFELNLDKYDFEWSNNQKMQIIIELNKARNLAIEIGLKRAKWVFPLDGNVFIDSKGWQEIYQQIQTSPSNIIKLNMYRVKQDNSEIKDFKIEDYDEQEEQIIFREDCFVRFDESLGYGYSNKLQLLKNLSIAPSYKYVIRMNDFTYGYINTKRYKDRKKAIDNFIEKVESMYKQL